DHREPGAGPGPGRRQGGQQGGRGGPGRGGDGQPPPPVAGTPRLTARTRPCYPTTRGAQMATQKAAIPSARPRAPRPSRRVAFTLTSAWAPQTSLSLATMAGT